MSTVLENKFEWEDYAQSFHSIMPAVMVQLNQFIANELYGDIIDYGCGAGKLVPYLNENASVTSYTGIDFSKEMIELANSVGNCHSNLTTQFVHSDIMLTALPASDCAVSVNSFYSWPKPNDIIDKIYQDLKPGGVFILATLLKSIDMVKLLEEAEPEFINHDYWQAFKSHNLKIMDNPGINLVTITELCDLLERFDFNVLSVDASFYDGGVGLVKVRK